MSSTSSDRSLASAAPVSSDTSVGSLVRRLAVAALLLAAVTVFASIALAF
jgi:hypothetical protein